MSNTRIASSESKIELGKTISSRDPENPKCSKRIGILMFHGMGQQVPFETLDCIAKSLRQEARLRGDVVRSQTARLIDIDGAMAPRVELLIDRTAGSAQEPDQMEVHLYESYWAPITEGKVTLRDVLLFLLEAGINGTRRALSGRFVRWMFGGTGDFRVQPSSFLYLLVMTFAIASLFTIYFALFVLGAARVGHFVFQDLEMGRIGATGTLLHYFFASLLSAGVLIAVLSFLGKPFASQTFRRVLFWLMNSIAVLEGIITLFFAISIIQTALSQCDTSLIEFLGASIGIGRTGVEQTFGSITSRSWVSALLFWSFGLVSLLVIRYFTIQFVGDVAAYVSAHKDSKFNDIRIAIQKKGIDSASLLFGVKDPTGNPYYTDVLFVGHSLGSVIAYDTLNAMVNRDEAAGRSMKVVDRMSGLMTFGSPLNKTAFIFSNFLKSAEYREALAEAVQPLITSSSYRPKRWINIWSMADWVSGKLTYYDDPAVPPPASNVENIIDKQAYVPGKAHTEYWSHTEVPKQLYDLL